MLIKNTLIVMVFTSATTTAVASSIKLTFIPTANNGEASFILPDDSLVSTGTYSFTYNYYNSGEPPPTLPSGGGSAIFSDLDPATGQPTGTSTGGLNLPGSFYSLNFTYTGEGHAQGSFYISNAFDDSEFAFNWHGQSYYTGGQLAPVNIGTIPGDWAVSYDVNENVPEATPLPLILFGVANLLALRRRMQSPSC